MDIQFKYNPVIDAFEHTILPRPIACTDMVKLDALIFQSLQERDLWRETHYGNPDHTCAECRAVAEQLDAEELKRIPF